MVTAPLSVPCATTTRDVARDALTPLHSPVPDPSVLPAGTARPRLPAVPARPGLMQAALPGKPGRFPTGWGSRTGGRRGRGVPAAVLRTPGTGRATRRLPGALLTRRTRSGSGGVGWRLWLRCKRWGPAAPAASPPPAPAAPALHVPASPLRSGPRSTPMQRCHGGACPAPAGRAGCWHRVLAPGWLCWSAPVLGRAGGIWREQVGLRPRCAGRCAGVGM